MSLGKQPGRGSFLKSSELLIGRMLIYWLIMRPDWSVMQSWRTHDSSTNGRSNLQKSVILICQRRRVLINNVVVSQRALNTRTELNCLAPPVWNNGYRYQTDRSQFSSFQLSQLFGECFLHLICLIHRVSSSFSLRR